MLITKSVLVLCLASMCMAAALPAVAKRGELDGDNYSVKYENKREELDGDNYSVKYENKREELDGDSYSFKYENKRDELDGEQLLK